MLGVPVVCYLFLGGAGAGGCFVLSLMGLLVPRENIAMTKSRKLIPGKNVITTLYAPKAYQQLFAPGYTVCLIALVVGMVCLLADMGRADRILLLLTQPAFSFIAIGAWALAVCLVLTALLAAAWAGLGNWWFMLVRILQASAMVIAFLVMVYTGLLLQSLQAVPLWATLWLPVLFTLSSLSCGVALIVMTNQFTIGKNVFVTVLHRVIVLDIAVIVIELVVTSIFIATVYGVSTDANLGDASNRTLVALANSGSALLSGQRAWLFWGGFVGVGMVVPLVLEVAFIKTGHKSTQRQAVFMIILAVCVLTGGALMRYCIVEAGMQPAFAAVATVGL